MANILITGASGYLGGDLFDHLKTATLPKHGKIYALVRSDDQAQQVEKLYNAEPMRMDLSDEFAITKSLTEHKITIVWFLIDAMKADAQLKFVRALHEAGKALSTPTHFLHTSGAKLFSAFAGFPTDGILKDSDPKLYELAKSAKAQFPPVQTASDANALIIDEGKKLGVNVYIFIPCIVYGESAGFGNKISIQTKEIVRAAKGVGRVHKPDNLEGTWPVSHVRDNSALYADILSSILAGRSIPINEAGFYLASSGSLAWSEMYAAAAKALKKRGIVNSDEVAGVDDAALEKAAKALKCPKDYVSLMMGGKCALTAANGPSIGWKHKYNADHILEVMDAEVELILKHI